MQLSEYLQLRNQQISVTTGNATTPVESSSGNVAKVDENGNTFAQALQKQIEQRGGVEFSNHAIKRLESRNIDVSENDKLERLNKGVEIAAEKGSSDTLVLVDSTAFVVSVKNNTVITTLSQEDLKGNIFTNIDSTVIM